MNKPAKVTSLAFAVILQILPMIRQAIAQIADYAPNLAIIFRWGVGLSAVLGGVDAVSGASTVRHPVAPSITKQPASRTVTAGANVSFTVTTTGTTPLSFHWTFNDTPIAGGTSRSLTLHNVQTSNAGRYAVTVANVLGGISSATATLAVNPAFPRTTFAGLIVDPTGAALESSGGFTLKTRATGKLGGRLTMAGAHYALHGQFNTNGQATVTIPRPNGTPLTTTFQTDLATGALTVTGVVNDATWQAELTSQRLPGLPAAPAGTYAVTITDGTNTTTASIVIGATASTKLTGTLPTGATLKAATLLTYDGQIPVFVPAGKDGAVIGWLVVNAGQVIGELGWLHADGTTSTLTVKAAP